ncbi:MAG: nuclear transport factor 2 family protein [Flavobacteriaceae bacterium]
MNTKFFLLTLTLLFTTITNSQNKTSDLEKTIYHHDSIFWDGYNKCNIPVFEKYITDDFEFYHDKGGLTVGKQKFLNSVSNGLCNKTNTWTLRREVVKGSTKVYVLNKYGAILSGEHNFFLKQKDGKEKLVETAKFTHVWKQIGNTWKMSRVLSYDHQDVNQNTSKKSIVLSGNKLQSFAGNYKAPKTGDITISLIEGKLNMIAGKMKATLHPQSESLFFMKQAPLTFEFLKNKEGIVQKMIVREQGTVVEEAIKQ